MSTKEQPKANELKIDHDLVNEQVVIAAAMVLPFDASKKLVNRLMPDSFQNREHQAIWTAFKELYRQGMTFDLPTLKLVGVEHVRIDYLTELQASRPEAPPNLDFHVETFLWDAARIGTARGPLASLLREIKDPLADPGRVQSSARQVVESLNGYKERKYIRDPQQLIAETISGIRARAEGKSLYTYGLKGLDFFEDGTHRMVPGPAPGQMTLVVGVSGAGKSTLTCRIVLGLARQRRRVLYCAWEMNSPVSIELIAAMSLGWSRKRLQFGYTQKEKTGTTPMTEDEFTTLRERMESFAPWIRFMDIPFGRARNEKVSNERNLDLIHGYVADSGCDVVVYDLWKRCLVSTEPDDEEQALKRQQSINEETKTHAILVHQLRLKDIETRQDKHPTRESIKGSGAWIEMPDEILAVHRPGLWKQIDDDVLEIDVLKQRHGDWPLAVQCDWHADRGVIDGGTSIPYDSFSTEHRNPIDDLKGSFNGRGKSRK